MSVPSRPNIVYILTDDQGPWAAGCYGNPEIRTPNIDRIAATGLRLDRFFVATPVCSASRATLLTGRIPSQHGVHDWIKAGDVGPDAIRYLEGELAYTDVLARHGWTCALSGKWHLGDSQIPQHGFSHWFAHQKGGGPYHNAPMVRDGQLVTEPRYVTDAITDEALMLIDRYHQAGIPFYLSVHYTAPHSPWTGHPPEIVHSYDACPFQSCPQEPPHPWAGSLTQQCLGNREMLKGYFAAVTAMDLGVGRILDRLEARGLRENTLVVFMSDNGFSCGHHGFWGKGNGTTPRNMYENSVRVPAIFSHPGVIPPGRASDVLLSAYDWMPTLLDYLGLPLPPHRNLPGRSFAPLLRGEPLGERENVVVFDEYGPVRMVRTREWKLVYRHAHGPHELYHLAEDPDERRNLANEPAYAGRVAELKAVMDEWFARYVNPRRDGLHTDGTEHGQTRYWPAV
ncbi:MAG: sulfatase-like hydrolase/transferase [Armatimonadota bacterium]|nr:sulfatase-like hydrolase/transferase [Armatimonadota bacterium]